MLTRLFSDAARRNVPPTTLGEFHSLFLSSPSCTSKAMLTDTFPCMILHRRNLACIGCGCPRSSDGASTSIYQTPNMPSRVLPSPRFASSNNPPVSSNPPPNPSFSLSQSQPAIYHSPAPQPHMIPQKSAHPLLTPSGRAFAVGGKVQNVSSDPLSPCVMYWPDNEAFPEQGQIRPSGLVGVPVSHIATVSGLRVADGSFLS